MILQSGELIKMTRYHRAPMLETFRNIRLLRTTYKRIRETMQSIFNPLKILVRPAGIEPATLSLEG